MDEYTAKSTGDLVELLSSGGPTDILRFRLKELTWRSLEQDPRGLGLKSLDLGWKKIYYEPASIAKRLRKVSELIRLPLASGGVKPILCRITSLGQKNGFLRKFC